MTQTAHVAARDSRIQNPPGSGPPGPGVTAQERRVPEPHSCMSGFARASFPLQKVKRTPAPPHRPGYRHHPVRQARRSPPSGAGFHTSCVPFPGVLRTRVVYFAPTRVGGVRLCTDLGLPQPALDGHWRSTSQRGRWKTASLRTEGKGEPFSNEDIQRAPAPSECSPGAREHGQRLPHPALGAPQGDARTMVLVRHDRQLAHPAVPLRPARGREMTDFAYAVHIRKTLRNRH